MSDRYEFGKWNFSYEGFITNTLIDTKTGTKTVVTMTHKDIIKSTPAQLINLVTDLWRNAING